MTTVSAKIIQDSVAPSNARLTTLQLRYPRFIHSEFMTHRTMSRNASSSRAIPVERLISDIERDPAIPLFWGKNQKGMQAGEEHNALVDGDTREVRWLQSMYIAIDAAKDFAEVGYHKQIVNRLLEPYAHINVIVTATDWDNFFKLRDHPDAEPHIQLLAQRIKTAMNESEPVFLEPGEGHYPYCDMITENYNHEVFASISVARCARVSYLTHEGKSPTVEQDIQLAKQLYKDGHMSPFEHVAYPHMKGSYRSGNFLGWTQYRQMLEN